MAVPCCGASSHPHPSASPSASPFSLTLSLSLSLTLSLTLILTQFHQMDLSSRKERLEKKRFHLQACVLPRYHPPSPSHKKRVHLQELP